MAFGRASNMVIKQMLYNNVEKNETTDVRTKNLQF